MPKMGENKTGLNQHVSIHGENQRIDRAKAGVAVPAGERIELGGWYRRESEFGPIQEICHAIRAAGNSRRAAGDGPCTCPGSINCYKRFMDEIGSYGGGIIHIYRT